MMFMLCSEALEVTMLRLSQMIGFSSTCYDQSANVWRAQLLPRFMRRLQRKVLYAKIGMRMHKAPQILTRTQPECVAKRAENTIVLRAEREHAISSYCDGKRSLRLASKSVGRDDCGFF